MHVGDEWIASAGGDAATGAGSTPEAAVASLADNLRFMLGGVEGTTEEEKQLRLAKTLRGGRSLQDDAEEAMLATRFGSSVADARRERIALGSLLTQRSL